MKFLFCFALIILLASCSSKNYRLCDLEHYEKAWSTADLVRCK